MVWPINDFDEDIFRILGVPDQVNERDFNETIDELTGQQPLKYYDPLTPIINRLNLKIEDSVFDDTPAFI